MTEPRSRSTLAWAALALLSGCAAFDPCEAGDPCTKGQVCVFYDGRAQCSDACSDDAGCGSGQSCNTCAASGECPTCTVCVAACLPP